MLGTMNLGELVETERERLGLTGRELARRADVSPAVISRLESGHRLGRIDTIMRITAALGLDPKVVERLLAGQEIEAHERGPSVDDLLAQIQVARRRESDARDDEQRRIREQLEGIGEGPILVELLSQPMSAGGGAPEAELPSVLFWPPPGERNHHYKAVEVVGDCLEPRIMHGHFVIVDLSARDDAKPGDVVAAQHDGEYLVKILEARDGLLFLVALQGQEPIQVDGQFTRLIGVVKGAYYKP